MHRHYMTFKLMMICEWGITNIAWKPFSFMNWFHMLMQSYFWSKYFVAIIAIVLFNCPFMFRFNMFFKVPSWCIFIMTNIAHILDTIMNRFFMHHQIALICCLIVTQEAFILYMLMVWSYMSWSMWSSFKFSITLVTFVPNWKKNLHKVFGSKNQNWQC